MNSPDPFLEPERWLAQDSFQAHDEEEWLEVGRDDLIDAMLEGKVVAGLLGHDLGPFDLLDENQRFQAECSKCGGIAWVAEDGQTFKLLEEICKERGIK